jgi:hypothetical protein
VFPQDSDGNDDLDRITGLSGLEMNHPVHPVILSSRSVLSQKADGNLDKTIGLPGLETDHVYIL